MALITSMPSSNEIPLSLYTTVKTSIAILKATNIHSLALVQSRLLVSLFEVGHGFDTTAYISIGATARAAAAIGLNQLAQNQEQDNCSV